LQGGFLKPGGGGETEFLDLRIVQQQRGDLTVGQFGSDIDDGLQQGFQVEGRRKHPVGFQQSLQPVNTIRRGVERGGHLFKRPDYSIAKWPKKN
jgi:hypothetical protein